MKNNTIYKDNKALWYFESHITIEPVFDERLHEFVTIAKSHKFHVADLLMRKKRKDSEVRSDKDSFCTSRSTSFNDIEERTIALVKDLQHYGFDVWRYKIEDTLLDSRCEDIYGLLYKKITQIRGPHGKTKTW